MGTRPAPSTMTARQEKWFASVAEGLERETGRSMDEWVAIARTCPETRRRARAVWLKDNYGIGSNRAALIFGAAFPDEAHWADGDGLRSTLWSAPADAEILRAVEAAVAGLDGVVHSQRKSFSAWSRKVQFAAARPIRGGGVWLGLAVPPDADPRLEGPKNESWSERLKSKLRLDSPADVDESVRQLLQRAWEGA